jgi:hypothetical protein
MLYAIYQDRLKNHLTCILLLQKISLYQYENQSIINIYSKIIS